MKKIIPIILIVTGAAILLGLLLFRLDSLTSAQPKGLGEQIFNALGLLLGAGTGLTGLIGLFKKEKPTEATRIVAMDDAQVATGENGRNIKQGDNGKYFEHIDHYHEAEQPEAHPALGSIPPFMRTRMFTVGISKKISAPHCAKAEPAPLWDCTRRAAQAKRNWQRASLRK